MTIKSNLTNRCVALCASIVTLLIVVGHLQPSLAGPPEDPSVKPFKINIDDSILEDLRARLDRTRFPDQIDGAGWDYGTDLSYLKELVEYWRAKFDWRKQERKLNEFPQFTTEIDGLDIHFIHARSKHENALPLVLAHGRNDGEHVAGIHLTLVGTPAPDDMENPEEGIPEWELKRTKDRREWWNGENAYGNIQGTKPQTLGYGLNDSPAGLAAWIIEKWRTWADTKGDIESRFTKDELLTNVMIYWSTESIASSTRIYYESRRNARDSGWVKVPTAVAIFPGEIFFSPRKWVETAYNVKQWTEMPRGGHFAAMEEPELLVEDVRKFFRTVR